MTWDDKNLALVLTTCDRCGRPYYMPAGRTRCIRCREQAGRGVADQQG